MVSFKHLVETELEVLRAQVDACRNCDLWKNATQAVFGEGPVKASMLLVGEAPGDHEDVEGHPFVGPAGRVLDQALAAAGIDRGEVYMTNAVKHFKWIPKGTRRLHQKPNRAEIVACHPWLEAEIELIDPDVVVCLGATAAQSLLGPAFRLTQHRGEAIILSGRTVFATIHPSAVLRAVGHAAREEAFDSLTSDLRRAKRSCQAPRDTGRSPSSRA